MEQPSVIIGKSAAWATVQEYRRLCPGRAGSLKVDYMPVPHIE
jgi:hypothetical protein